MHSVQSINSCILHHVVDTESTASETATLILNTLPAHPTKGQEDYARNRMPLPHLPCTLHIAIKPLWYVPLVCASE
jgi:hypothetical protein